ncbi:MAG: hypothetical protein EXS31_00610 [Pedosphaera sp.]|nr:hypothetical protein [Pedosphaera sp.]
MLGSGTGYKAVLAGVQLLVFLSLLFLVASRDLHLTFHPNAKDADHNCGVTLLASGGLEPASSNVVLPRPLGAPPALVEFSFSLPSSFLRLLPHGRAPPVV